MRLSILLVPLLVLQIGATRAGGLSFQSTERQTTLLELYTSEGCSSCPPAEAWLSLRAGAPGLWREFVPVAFHVDYWDGLGWKDRFASPLFTQRQRAYAAAWGLGSVYTPGFVVNGHESRGYPALQAGDGKSGVLKITWADDKWEVRFTPSGTGTEWDGHLALLGSGLISPVARGENAGRDLRHDFVALSYTSGHLNGGRAEFAAPVTTEKGARLAIAAWITRRDDAAPVQATGGWLP